MDENIIDEESREKHLEESGWLQFWVTGGLFFIVICIVFPPVFIIGILFAVFTGIITVAIKLIGCFIKKIPAKTVFLFLKNIPKDNYNLLNYIVILFLALAVFFDPEYGFYTFLRILVTTFCCWTIYKICIREKESKLLLLFGGIAILFNPIVKIVLEYNVWQIIDIITFGILIWWSIFYNKKFNNIEEIAETIKRKAISEILDEIKNNKDV